ncbi:MAG TPA: DUF5979 domain-containing protein [Actinomycetes bacterium]
MRPFGRRTGGRLARVSAFAVLALALVVSGAGPALACGGPVTDTGTVKVTKALAEGSAPAGDQTFAIKVSCDNSYDQTFPLAVGESATTDPLPVATVCTVSEYLKDGWQTPTITPSEPVTVVKDATSSVTVANFKKPHELKQGTITVTKALAEGSEQPAQGQTFPVTVTCDKVEYSETFNLSVGQSETTDPLPIGTKCTVSEEPPPGWDTPGFQPSAEVTSDKGDTAVTVVNNLTSKPPEGRTGKIEVTKTLAAGTVADPGQTFPITVACEKAGYDKTFEFSLAVGDTKELKKLPVGAVCTVSEAVPSGWNTPSIQPTSEVTVVKGAGVDVTVVNSRTVTPTPQPVYRAGLTLTKDNEPKDVVEVGKNITYILTATASGNVSQSNVGVSDVVPTGTTYVTGSAKCVAPATCAAGYDVTTRTVSWTLGTMNPGDSVTVTFKVTTNTGLAPNTVITNVGTVASSLTSAISNETTNRLAEVKGEVIVGPTTPTAVSPAAVAGETLAATGAGVPVGYLIGTGIGLIALGALLMALTRRSRSA